MVFLFRDSLAAQLEITLTKADSEQLARSIAEEQYSDLEKEKIMKELEIKEMMARHKQELAEKYATISSVRTWGWATVGHVCSHFIGFCILIKSTAYQMRTVCQKQENSETFSG